MSRETNGMLDHYRDGKEAGRLSTGAGLLERERTREALTRFLPPAPAVVLDVGGGPGAHACWLAARGYEVHLVDPVPLHVEQAREASAGQPAAPIAGVALGDARALDRADASVDAVLLLGPLYHLQRREERLAALREARRVLRSPGVAIVAAISRYASALDGLFRGLLADPGFAMIVDGDLSHGRHENPTGHPEYFTTAYFHAPGELEEEIVASGLRHETTMAVEGPGWLLGDLDRRMSDPVLRESLLGMLRRLESEPALIGASAHLLAVARRED